MSDRAERLVNLTIALLEARRPLTYAEIRARTGLYPQPEAESARRMFERDKDALRELGVPLETVATDAFAHDTGYLVERSRYEIPDIDLTAEEMMALALAMRVAGDDRDRLALAKIGARAPDPIGAEPPSIARVELAADGLEILSGAVAERRQVRFDYRTAQGATSRRTVDAWSIAQRRGAGYLVGFDRERGARRVFRLDRLIGSPVALDPPGAFDAPDERDRDATSLVPEETEVTARLAVTDTSRWDLEQAGATASSSQRDGQLVYRWTAPSGQIVRTALALLDQIELTMPRQLREQVAVGLESILRAHPDGS